MGLLVLSPLNSRPFSLLFLTTIYKLKGNICLKYQYRNIKLTTNYLIIMESVFLIIDMTFVYNIFVYDFLKESREGSIHFFAAGRRMWVISKRDLIATNFL